MRLYVPPKLQQVIDHHARAAFPNECCGLLIGQSVDHFVSLQDALPAQNVAPPHLQPARFAIDPLFLLKIDRSRPVVGVYHSHPNHPPIPSQTDLAAAWPGYIYVIVSVTPNAPPLWRAWQLADETFTECPLQFSRPEGCP